MLKIKKKGNKYEIVNTVSFLIGVRKEIFQQDVGTFKGIMYNKLMQKSECLLIRSLCILRNNLEYNYDIINRKLTYSHCDLSDLDSYIDIGALDVVRQSGIRLRFESFNIVEYIKEINSLIDQNIDKCQYLFPSSLNWLYIRSVFLMPGGNIQKRIVNEGIQFISHRSFYPYQMYIGLQPDESDGNVLYNDIKFLKFVYRKNNDRFDENILSSHLNKLTEKDIINLNNFLSNKERILVVVDCENTQLSRFYNYLIDSKLCDNHNIDEIVLFADVNASSNWNLLSKFFNVNISYQSVNRILENKSLVDFAFMQKIIESNARREHDGFIIVSSDSDYISLLRSVSSDNLMFVLDIERTSYKLINKFNDLSIKYNIMPEYTGTSINELSNSDSFITEALMCSIREILGSNTKFNIQDMFEQSIKVSGIFVPNELKESIYKRILNDLQLSINGDIVSISI